MGNVEPNALVGEIGNDDMDLCWGLYFQLGVCVGVRL